MTTIPTASLSSLLEQKGRQIFAVAPETTVYDAISMMSDRGVGALLVMEGERLRGIISERDYTRKVILQGRSSKDTRVNEIMTGDVIAAQPHITVEDAMRLMTEHRIRHLPVIANERVEGMVSIGDLVKSVISHQKETIAHLHHYIAGSYMA